MNDKLTISTIVTDAANELDQLFRQRHKHEEVAHLLTRLIHDCRALDIPTYKSPGPTEGEVIAAKKLLRIFPEAPVSIPLMQSIADVRFVANAVLRWKAES